MALNCNVCECLKNYVGDTESFQYAMLQLLCEIQTNTSDPYDTELVCASTDGRLLLLTKEGDTYTLTEIDGSPILDGATAVPCSSSVVAVTQDSVCFEANGDVYRGYVQEVHRGDGTTIEKAFDRNRTVEFFRPDFLIVDCPCNCTPGAEAEDDTVQRLYPGTGELLFDVKPNDVLLPGIGYEYDPSSLIPPTGVVTVNDYGNGIFGITPVGEGTYSFEYSMICEADNSVVDTATVSGDVTLAVIFTLDGISPIEWTGTDYVDQCLRIGYGGESLQGIADVTAYMAINYPAHTLNSADGTWDGPTAGVINVIDAEFITTWETTAPSQSLQFPMRTNEAIDIVIDWGDGTPPVNIVKAGGAAVPASATHVYAVAGIYEVKVCGDYPRFHLEDTDVTSKNSILTIEQWGDTLLVETNMDETTSTLLTIDGAFPPSVSSLSGFLGNTPNANPDVSSWDLSNINNTSFMFRGAAAATVVGSTNWDVSNVTNVQSMFQSAAVANPDTSLWDVSNITIFTSMFNNAANAAPDTSNWVTTSALLMISLFQGITSDPDVSGFDMVGVTEVSAMFADTPNANPDVSQWDTSTILSFTGMFENTDTANPDVSNWDTSSATGMYEMFREADAADPDVSNWDVSNVSNMGSMFQGCDIADPDVSLWNTASVAGGGFSNMFAYTSVANPDVSGFNTSNATNLSGMFRNTSVANPDVSSWDLNGVTSINSMFYFASGANPDCSAWDFSTISNAGNAFAFSGLTTPSYDALLIQAAATALVPNVTLDAGPTQYTIATSGAARTYLTGTLTWTINDGGGI